MKFRLRSILLLSLLTLCCIPSIRAKESGTEKLNFVMVHGATAGAWEWKTTAKCLENDGHEVHRVTLTGLGERYHLASEAVNLDTHIDDVVNIILFEDLHDVVLTGHSYGGMVITGVMNRIPEGIRHTIYLDAAVPENGQSAFDRFGGPPENAKIANGTIDFGWGDPDGPFPKNVPHPIETLRQPVTYDNPEAFKLPVTYVAFIPEGHSAQERAKNDKSWQVAEKRGWTIRTFPGSHVAMLENPRGLASLLEEAVHDQNK